MGDRVFVDLDLPNLRVDRDDRGMRGIAPGDGRRFPVIGLLEPGLYALRPAVVPAGARGMRYLGETDRRPRYTDDTDTVVPQFEIGSGALQQIGGDCEGLLPQALVGMVECGRHVHG